MVGLSDNIIKDKYNTSNNIDIKTLTKDFNYDSLKMYNLLYKFDYIQQTNNYGNYVSNVNIQSQNNQSKYINLFQYLL